MDHPELRACGAEEDKVGYPSLEWRDGQPVPDLNPVAEERWRETLAPLTHPVRMLTMRGVEHMLWEGRARR